VRDRLVTAGGALLAFVVLYVLMFGAAPEPAVSRPTTEEAGRNGYLAVKRWLEVQGVRVVSWRERFDRLLEADSGLAATGNLVITTMPHVYAVRLTEQQVLQAWLRRGNSLLVLAALDDTPEWSPNVSALDFMAQLQAMTGLVFTPASRAGAASPPGADSGAERDNSKQRRIPDDSGNYLIAAESDVVLEPRVSHPLLEGVEQLRARTDGQSLIWDATPVPNAPASRLLLRLASEQRSGRDALWQIPIEEGQIIVAAVGSLLANHLVADSDTDRLLANILQHHLAPAGAVLFDDMHQGLTVLYDPSAFFGDSRLHATLLFLLAAWLVYILGTSNRLAPPAPVSAAPRQTDLLGAVGGFFARRLDRVDLGRLLLDDWFREIRRSRGLAAADAPPWAELEATPALDRSLLRQLNETHEKLARGRPVSLVRLHNLLCQARKAIG
jgi:hypothetical protein